MLVTSVLSAGTDLLILPQVAVPFSPHPELKLSSIRTKYLKVRASKQSVLTSLSTEFKTLQALAHLWADPPSAAVKIKNFT